jgi:hypothetical protein
MLMVYRMMSRAMVTMNMAMRMGIRGSAFLGVITSSMSRWDSIGLMIIIPDVTAERAIAAINGARLPFR